MITNNPSKSHIECLELLFEQLQKIHRALPFDRRPTFDMRSRIIVACRGNKECDYVLMKKAITYEGICADLRSSVAMSSVNTVNSDVLRPQAFPTDHMDDDETDDQYYMDRRYGGNGRFRGNSLYGRNSYQRGNSRGRNYGRSGDRFKKKTCFICGKENCWSTSPNHTDTERREAYDKYKNSKYHSSQPTAAKYGSFLVATEGVMTVDEAPSSLDHMIMEMEEDDGSYGMYVTEIGEIDGTKTVALLND